MGLVVFLYYARIFIQWVYVTFLAPKDLPLTRYIKGKKQPWALVTGSTEGIGKEYAFQLARKGLSIILCARNQQKMEGVAQEIKEKYPNVEVKYIVVDASIATTEEDFERISKEVEGLELTFLVNNVGISHLSKPVEEISADETKNLININLRFPTLITRAVLSTMKKNAKKDSRGAIINVSSLSGLGPTPYLTIYSSTKLYNRAFSHSLELELKESNIDVQAVSPGFVRTAMTSKMRPDFRHCSSDLVVIGSLDQLPSQEVQPFWVHAVQGASVLYPPQFVANYVVNYRMTDFKERVRRKTSGKGKEE